MSQQGGGKQKTPPCNQEHEDQLSSHSDPTEAESYRRLSYQSLKLQQYLWLWQRKLLPEKEVDFVICMDSDMLVVAEPGASLGFSIKNKPVLLVLVCPCMTCWRR